MIDNWRKIANKVCGIVLSVTVLGLSGCGKPAVASTTTQEVVAEDVAYTQDIEAMDTVMSLTAYGPNGEAAVKAAILEIERLDALLSTGDEESEVYQINHAGGGTLSDTTAELLQRSIELYESTGGLFDIAIYPVMEAWGFTNQQYQVPDSEELTQLLALADVSNLVYDSKTKEMFFTQNGMAIDFGGIAKGYTSARIMEIYQEYGVTSGLVSLGGNVHVLGTKVDGSLWRVGVRNPNDENGHLGVLSVEDCAVITSGGYERYFEEDGVTYHHIIDPRTGYPADSGVTSVTIVSKDGALADGLSTALYIMGVEEAISYWSAHSEEFGFVIFDGEKVYVTEDLQDQFGESDYEIEIVTCEK